MASKFDNKVQKVMCGLKNNQLGYVWNAWATNDNEKDYILSYKKKIDFNKFRKSHDVCYDMMIDWQSSKENGKFKIGVDDIEQGEALFVLNGVELSSEDEVIEFIKDLLNS